MINYLHELMRKYTIDVFGKKWIVRVWIKCEFLEDSKAYNTYFEISDYLSNLNKIGLIRPEIFSAQLAYNFGDRINAVEVTDEMGYGGLTYIDWP